MFKLRRVSQRCFWSWIGDFFTHTPDAFTQLGQALHFYGVALRYTPTPPAKGKIERRHHYWQDRLGASWPPTRSATSTPPTNSWTSSCPTPTRPRLPLVTLRLERAHPRARRRRRQSPRRLPTPEP